MRKGQYARRCGGRCELERWAGCRPTAGQAARSILIDNPLISMKSFVEKVTRKIEVQPIHSLQRRDTPQGKQSPQGGQLTFPLSKLYIPFKEGHTKGA